MTLVGWIVALQLLVVCFVHIAFSASVTVAGRKLYVNNTPFTVKAVAYSPTPVGIDPTLQSPYGDYFTSAYSSMWKRDIPLIQQLGANTMKLSRWNNTLDHTLFLDTAVNNSLFVIPTFYISSDIYPDLSNTTRITVDFGNFVNHIDGHPAILFYELGTELNAVYASQKDALFQVLNNLVQMAKKIEAPNPRPFSTALNDMDSITTIQQYDKTTVLDLWSINAYRGCQFGTLFSDFQKVSTRPVFISEFGIDAYDDVSMSVNEQSQSDCYAWQWYEIQSNSTVAIGGSATEYVDEYWKSKQGKADSRHPGCPSNSPSRQLNCGTQNDNFPDKYSNLAYFGLVDSNFKPRRAYNQLRSLWNR